jgi:DNA polymerase III alpha subunit (gram-positive type)
MAPKTKYAKNKGGLESLRSLDNYKTSAENLQKMYPDWVTLYIRKTTGITEIRLKNKCRRNTNDNPESDTD